MKRVLAILFACAIGALGCVSSTSPAPLEEIGRAKLALEQAERSGGTQHAELEMKLAREELAAAESHSAAKEYEPARRAAEQAEVNARLALVKARRAEAQEAAHELTRTLHAMQEEIDHGTR
jgi:hypothetical protein